MQYIVRCIHLFPQMVTMEPGVVWIMEPGHKLVILLIAISLVVLSIVFVSLPAFGTLPVPSLTSVYEIIILFAVLVVMCAIAVFLLYRKATIRYPETEHKMTIRKRLEFK